jgi:hypothetical protein
MHLKMTACYFARTMPYWRHVVFVGHHDTSEMPKISTHMTLGRIKKIEDYWLWWHDIFP